MSNILYKNINNLLLISFKNYEPCFCTSLFQREVESLRKLVTKLNDEVEDVQGREKGLLRQIEDLKKEKEKINENDKEIKDELQHAQQQQHQQLSGDAKKLIDAGWTVAKVNIMSHFFLIKCKFQL